MESLGLREPELQAAVHSDDPSWQQALDASVDRLVLERLERIGCEYFRQLEHQHAVP